MTLPKAKLQAFRALLLATALLVCASSVNAEDTWRGDGSWRLAQSSADRATYLRGVLDGLALQERLVLQSHIDRESDSALIRQRQAESMAAPRQLLNGVNTLQVRDGLDVFYGDYRNRQIRVSSAMLIVIYRINGKSPEFVDRLLDSMRRLRE